MKGDQEIVFAAVNQDSNAVYYATDELKASIKQKTCLLEWKYTTCISIILSLALAAYSIIPWILWEIKNYQQVMATVTHVESNACFNSQCGSSQIMAEYEIADAVDRSIYTFESGCMCGNYDIGDSVKLYYLSSDPGDATLETWLSRAHFVLELFAILILVVHVARLIRAHLKLVAIKDALT